MKPIHDLRVGEIFVGGEGLSRGYWNRPELNAEKFVQIEIEPDSVIRLYRTGDLGRYNNSKVLEFVGRTDFQVKIRGFRVEPEENRDCAFIHAGTRCGSCRCKRNERRV